MVMPSPNIRIARNTFSLLPYMYFLSTENFIFHCWKIKLTFVLDFQILHLAKLLVFTDMSYMNFDLNIFMNVFNGQYTLIKNVPFFHFHRYGISHTRKGQLLSIFLPFVSVEIGVGKHLYSQAGGIRDSRHSCWMPLGGHQQLMLLKCFWKL